LEAFTELGLKLRPLCPTSIRMMVAEAEAASINGTKKFIIICTAVVYDVAFT
jgi:hypothetical protein